MITYQTIEQAHQRVKPYIHHTPIVSSQRLNRWLGHEIFFKGECLQKVGAFKARGGCNAVAHAIEQRRKVTHIVANSSGNHAQAVAWAAKMFDIPATIYMPANVSKVKAQATRDYGAHVVLCENRIAVDQAVQQAAQQPDVLWIPPYNHPDVIAGQGTATLEALHQINDIDAVFAPCGGGGLLSGTLIAAKYLKPNIQVCGVEPLGANDAAESLRHNKIIALAAAPNTIADGARTPSVGDLTFEYLKQLDHFYEAPEEAIIYWTQWLTHLLKLTIEPTSAMSMFGAIEWLKTQKAKQRVLVIVTGGNLDQGARETLWQQDYLAHPPSITMCYRSLNE
jgi:threonine dehydratase